jgi:hypothetical protein
MHRAIIIGSLLALALAGCGEGVARTTGTIRAELSWTGSWPEDGTVLAVLFRTPPWDPDFVPGAPVAYEVVSEPADDHISFAMDNPGVAFGTYDALVVAWHDPDQEDRSKEMLPVSVLGTTLDDLPAADPVVLNVDHADLDLQMPAVVFYATKEDMRLHYSPVW